MNGRSFCAHTVRFVAHRVYAAGINPTVIEIEKSAHGDGVVNGFVCVADRMKRFNVGRLNGDRILIYLPHKAEQGLLGV